MVLCIGLNIRSTGIYSIFSSELNISNAVLHSPIHISYCVPFVNVFLNFFFNWNCPVTQQRIFHLLPMQLFEPLQSVLQFTLSTFTLLWPTPWSFICCPSFSNSSLILFSSSFHMSVRTVTSAITMATNNNSELSYSTRHYLGSKKNNILFHQNLLQRKNVKQVICKYVKCLCIIYMYFPNIWYTQSGKWKFIKFKFPKFTPPPLTKKKKIVHVYDKDLNLLHLLLCLVKDTTELRRHIYSYITLTWQSSRFAFNHDSAL